MEYCYRAQLIVNIWLFGPEYAPPGRPERPLIFAASFPSQRIGESRPFRRVPEREVSDQGIGVRRHFGLEVLPCPMSTLSHARQVGQVIPSWFHGELPLARVEYPPGQGPSEARLRLIPSRLAVPQA